jgi:hypothetical protein
MSKGVVATWSGPTVIPGLDAKEKEVGVKISRGTKLENARMSFHE